MGNIKDLCVTHRVPPIRNISDKLASVSVFIYGMPPQSVCKISGATHQCDVVFFHTLNDTPNFIA